jgi:hypothetical protein
MKNLPNGFWLAWHNIFRKLYFREGMPKREVYRIIAEKYNVTPNMVSSYIEPITDKDKAHHFSTYDFKYKRLIRHIDNLLPHLFNGNSELQLKEICNGIENLAGIYIKEGTLEKLLLKYKGKPRGLPVIKTESGSYKLNSSFYNC